MFHPGNDIEKMAVLVNAALVGVPAAYATSGSTTVTAIAAGVAALLVVAALAARR